MSNCTTGFYSNIAAVSSPHSLYFLYILHSILYFLFTPILFLKNMLQTPVSLLGFLPRVISF